MSPKQKGNVLAHIAGSTEVRQALAPSLGDSLSSDLLCEDFVLRLASQDGTMVGSSKGGRGLLWSKPRESTSSDLLLPSRFGHDISLNVQGPLLSTSKRAIY